MSRSKVKFRFFLLIIVISVILATAVRFSKSRHPGPTVDELSFDATRVSALWLYEKLRLPEPYAAQAKDALGDPEKLEKILRDYFLKQPVLKGLDPDVSSRVIRSYRKGVLLLSPNPPAPFHLPFDWAQDSAGLNFITQLHSLGYLPSFMKEYEETKDEALFEVVENVFLDWSRKNPYSKPSHPRAWFEGAVSARICVLLDLLNFYKSTGGPRQASLTLLLSSVYQHAQFLTRDETYQPEGNHGLRQDLGLLAASIAVPEFTNSGAWKALALKRMKERQINVTFSPEGVYLEHSPGYHQYSVLIIEDITELLRKNGLQNDVIDLEELIKKSNRYLTHVLTPLGKFPPVGDTAEKELTSELRSKVEDKHLEYSYTSGSAGMPPEELDGFFPAAGQVIYRDTWGTDHDTASSSVYVHMHAANHLPVGHRHADELSFVLQGFGRWWVLEAGKYSYDISDWRQYVKSAQAHNGYTFDGNGLDPLEETGNNRDVYFEEDYVSTPLLAAARAHSSRFPEKGTEVVRTYVFLRKQKTLVILDELNARRQGRWEAYLHLAPDLDVTIDNLRILAGAPDMKDMVLEITSEPGMTHGVRMVRGQKDPILGWYSPEYGKIIPSPALVFDRTGKDGVVATVLRLRGRAEKGIEDLRTDSEGGRYHITWSEGHKQMGLSISKDRPLRVRQF